MTVRVHHADMLEWLAAYDGPLFDACVTDPPYHLSSIVKRFGRQGSAAAKVGATGAYAPASRGFMGQQWDGGDVAFRPETWAKVFDRMKPGAHLVAFSGTRTYHRMACAIEDAGFEIRDQLAWAYGSGFPKSHDVAKALDKAAGHWRGRAGQVKIAEQVAKGTEYERSPKGDPITAAAAAWEGWGTALKPAWEPICLARKPMAASVAGNVLTHGTGALNIDGCRIEGGTGGSRDGEVMADHRYTASGSTNFAATPGPRGGDARGRWPANVLHDGSDEVLAAFPDVGPSVQRTGKRTGILGEFSGQSQVVQGHDDVAGSAARFFYSAKAGPLDRIGSAHATVKPVDLMRWLCRLITPPGGLILDPFAGSGTTGIAAMAEGFPCEMIELEAAHFADIERKLAYLRGEGELSFIEHDRHRAQRRADAPKGDLFGMPEAAA